MTKTKLHFSQKTKTKSKFSVKINTSCNKVYCSSLDKKYLPHV